MILRLWDVVDLTQQQLRWLQFFMQINARFIQMLKVFIQQIHV